MFFIYDPKNQAFIFLNAAVIHLLNFDLIMFSVSYTHLTLPTILRV